MKYKFNQFFSIIFIYINVKNVWKWRHSGSLARRFSPNAAKCGQNKSEYGHFLHSVSHHFFETSYLFCEKYLESDKISKIMGNWALICLWFFNKISFLLALQVSSFQHNPSTVYTYGKEWSCWQFWDHSLTNWTLTNTRFQNLSKRYFERFNNTKTLIMRYKTLLWRKI